MNIEDLLEHRHTYELEWHETWPATGPEGNDVYAAITLRATVHDCINLERSVAKAQGRPTMGNDSEFLQDFALVHWASVVNHNTSI